MRRSVGEGRRSTSPASSRSFSTRLRLCLVIFKSPSKSATVSPGWRSMKWSARACARPSPASFSCGDPCAQTFCMAKNSKSKPCFNSSSRKYNGEAAGGGPPSFTSVMLTYLSSDGLRNKSSRACRGFGYGSPFCDSLRRPRWLHLARWRICALARCEDPRTDPWAALCLLRVRRPARLQWPRLSSRRSHGTPVQLRAHHGHEDPVHRGRDQQCEQGTDQTPGHRGRLYAPRRLSRQRDDGGFRAADENPCRDRTVAVA